MNTKRLEGEVIFWKETYGFIRQETEDGISTYFFHLKNTANLNSEQAPIIGSRASFDIANCKPGKPPEAVNVRLSDVRPKSSNKTVEMTEGGAR